MRIAQAPLKNAEDILLQRCRSYIYRKRYFQLQVFSKWFTEVELLTAHYNGHWYKHGSGYVWMLTKRNDIIRLVITLQSSFPSESKFEDKILKVFPIKNDSR